MKHLYELYLKRNIRRSVEWHQIFQNWIQQKSSIIELYTHLDDIYGCTNITPYNKNISCKEFWTNTSEPEKDHETIAKLYAEELLYVTSPTCAL
ncbi:hypothetical protein RhiirB3_533276 [Rhizophagus irregularis]|nr:hypothetical protein RhiirB3_533276 [Rhizophagus irregularis]